MSYKFNFGKISDSSALKIHFECWCPKWTTTAKVERILPDPRTWYESGIMV